MADIFSCHNRKSTGATNNFNNFFIPKAATSKSNVAIIIGMCTFPAVTCEKVCHVKV